ncbi:MAG: NAD(P)H-hydrate dehydratase, partial [Pseudobutyrivibrio sp.]|nr:NAD(P)H-hydrate dehydratase [Pseudobutyrivibrio sp.]
LLLGECKEAAGQVIVADVGIYAKDESGYARLLDDEILSKAPVRSVSANKGSCGKLLVIAGSENIYGACYLAAEAALVAGAGLVKIYTHVNNIQAIREALPEAMYLGYDSFNRDELLEQLQWADTVLMGPGLGMSETAEELVVTTLEHFTGPMVIDADGINLTAKHLDLLKKYTSPVVLTPHLKEMERLTSTKTADINYDMERVASIFATRHKCTVILKNFTTVIANAYTISYCNSGNEGLATPGSGDVLAGITASLLAQGCVAEDAASIAAYTHGCAGRRASERVGVKSVLARDIIEELRINKN